MKAFKHVNARTIDEAVSLTSEKTKLLAGGVDYLNILKQRILPTHPETLINIKTIPGLEYVKEDSRGLKIGALTRLVDVEESPIVKEKYSMLAEATQSIASPQIRNMATVGGNLCQDVHCWYYRRSPFTGRDYFCYRKGGEICNALIGENRYHSIFVAMKTVTPPCSTDCPAKIDNPSYLAKVREGDLVGAARILLQNNPIPAITGRVCPHFCQQGCTRGQFDEAVSIRNIERYLGDYILENDIIKAAKGDSGKSVAIIGAGPAGLTAAYYLRMQGHKVTIFDRMEEGGGMLAYVIPPYRLPKDVVRRVVKSIENTGVEFRLGVDIGKGNVTVDSLKKQFDVVFIATGVWRPATIGLDGEELTRFGMDFLKNINLGIKEVPGKKVVVIGGGSAAIDVAITAKRLGAEEVIMACLESREEMPAQEWEIEQALEEGIRLMPSRGPVKVIRTGGKVRGIELIRCAAVCDSTGRFAPTMDNSVKETVKADQIMMAVGYGTELYYIDSKSKLKVERGLITADPQSQATSVSGIYAGGSVAHGAATVVEAIGSGRRAAIAIDAYLKGGAKAEEKEEGVRPLLKFNSDYIKKTSPVPTPKVAADKRGMDVEDNLGLGLSEVETDANRCFNCGCVAVNPSDIAVALMALNARFKTTKRIIDADEFFTAGLLKTTVLEPDEIVTEIQVPAPKAGNKQTLTKFRLRKSIDFAIVTVASMINTEARKISDASFVFGGVAPVPVRMKQVEDYLKGQTITEKVAEAAGNLAVEGEIPLPENKYKVQIARTLVKRAVLASK